MDQDQVIEILRSVKQVMAGRKSDRQQCHQHVEGAPAELDRLAVSEELAATRQYPETSERDARRCFGDAFHRSHDALCIARLMYCTPDVRDVSTNVRPR